MSKDASSRFVEADEPESLRRILQAFIQCVCEVGIERATYRLVAQRSGFSTGLVQHYFPTKNKLLVRAMMEVLEQMRESRPPVSDDATVYDFLENHFVAWLPLTSTLKEEWPFLIEYWRYSVRNPDLQNQSPGYKELSARATEAIRTAFELWGARSTFVPQDLADILTATMQGLALRMIMFPHAFNDLRVRTLLRQTLKVFIEEPLQVAGQEVLVESTSGPV